MNKMLSSPQAIFSLKNGLLGPVIVASLLSILSGCRNDVDEIQTISILRNPTTQIDQETDSVNNKPLPKSIVYLGDDIDTIESKSSIENDSSDTIYIPGNNRVVLQNEAGECFQFSYDNAEFKSIPCPGDDRNIEKIQPIIVKDKTGQCFKLSSDGSNVRYDSIPCP